MTSPRRRGNNLREIGLYDIIDYVNLFESCQDIMKYKMINT